VKSGDLISNSTISITVFDRIPEIRILVNDHEMLDGQTVDVNSFENVTFDGSGCIDPDGSILLFEWSVNGTKLSNSSNFVHFFEPGSYLVQLTVTDDGGNAKTISLYITSEGNPQSPGDGSLTGERENDDDGTINPFLVIATIFGLIMFLCLIFFIVIRKRRNGESKFDEDFEG
jgi:hypothetical protein